MGAVAAPGLPARYGWLPQLGLALPKLLQVALPLYGTHEITGKLDSPVIMGWATEVGLRAIYTADEIAWCGLFMAVVAKRAGKPVPDGPLWALNWAKFGVEAGQPALGDVLTFTRTGGGHVGLYVGEDSSAYHVLGGNTSDAVTIARIDKKRLYRARRPAYNAAPSTVRPYILAAEGSLSTNEA
jgi:uncharacterized protein (TIGR02594 family)